MQYVILKLWRQLYPLWIINVFRIRELHRDTAFLMRLEAWISIRNISQLESFVLLKNLKSFYLTYSLVPYVMIFLWDVSSQNTKHSSDVNNVPDIRADKTSQSRSVRSRGSSVSIVSDYGLDDRALIPDRGRGFSSSVWVQTGSGAHPASYPMGTGDPFSGGKARPGRHADHSPPPPSRG
jgi:hypothetical protein